MHTDRGEEEALSSYLVCTHHQRRHHLSCRPSHHGRLWEFFKIVQPDTAFTHSLTHQETLSFSLSLSRPLLSIGFSSHLLSLSLCRPPGAHT